MADAADAETKKGTQPDSSPERSQQFLNTLDHFLVDLVEEKTWGTNCPPSSHQSPAATLYVRQVSQQPLFNNG